MGVIGKAKKSSASSSGILSDKLARDSIDSNSNSKQLAAAGEKSAGQSKDFPTFLFL